MIRHGKTAGNLMRKYIGRTDEPLCPEGREEVMRLRSDPEVKHVYVSPMKRARETAKILFPNAVQEVLSDLREMDFGVFEGRSAEEMQDDPAYREWVAGMCRGTCPGGESLEDFRNRTVAAFLNAVRTAQEDEAVFVVHGGVIMSVLGELAEDRRDFYEWYAPNLCGYRFQCCIEDGVPVLRRIRAFAPEQRS